MGSQLQTAKPSAVVGSPNMTRLILGCKVVALSLLLAVDLVGGDFQALIYYKIPASASLPKLFPQQKFKHDLEGVQQFTYMDTFKPLSASSEEVISADTFLPASKLYKDTFLPVPKQGKHGFLLKKKDRKRVASEDKFYLLRENPNV